MIKDSRKPEKNFVTFSTIEERENYLSLLKQSIESLIIFSIHKTYSPNNIKKFKYDFLELGKYTDLLNLIQSGEEYSFSLETSNYTVEHFMPKAQRQNGELKYEYFFRVVFNDNLIAQRVKLKMDSFLKMNNSKNNLEKANQLISKNYYFSVPGDSILMMIRVDNALSESIESQETTIRGYVKAGVKRNVNKLRRIG